MSEEIRHTEKNLLIQLLRAKDMKDLIKVRTNLMGVMEPEDVKVVIAALEEEKKLEAES